MGRLMDQDLDWLYSNNAQEDAARSFSRWQLLAGLAKHSEDFCQATLAFANKHKTLLKVGSISGVMDLLGISAKVETGRLPKRLRPKGEWTQTDPVGYLVEMPRLCHQFGLAPQEWEDVLGAFLREALHEGDEPFRAYARSFLWTTPVSLPGPLPWAPHPRKRGRPSLLEKSTHKELTALAHCAARRIAGQSWEEITDSADAVLLRKKADGDWDVELMVLRVRTKVQRFAQHLQVSLP